MGRMEQTAGTELLLRAVGQSRGVLEEQTTRSDSVQTLSFFLPAGGELTFKLLGLKSGFIGTLLS